MIAHIVRFGYCECGCGELAPISPRTDRAFGWIKGEPKRFIKGHATRKSAQEYRVDETTGCWVWLKAISSGYGVITYRVEGGKQTRRAHVVYWERVHGPVPDGLELDHACHNPTTCAGGPTCPHRRCVNPDHLRLATHLENSRRGSHARFTNTEVAVIRERMKAGEHNADLAREYGVNPSTMSRIRTSLRWA
jgi:hypothetical protein